MFFEKEQALFKALEEHGFEPFDDALDACDFIEARLGKIIDYPNVVARHVSMTPMLRFRFEGQDLIDKLEDLNDQRVKAHNACIDSFNQLNRLCERYDIEKFSEVDTTNRLSVAAEAGRYVNEAFSLGLKDNFFDKAVEEAQQKEFDRKNPKERWSRNVERGNVDV